MSSYRGPDDLVVLHLQEEQLPQDFFDVGGAGVGFLISLTGPPLWFQARYIIKATIPQIKVIKNIQAIVIISLLLSKFSFHGYKPYQSHRL